MLETGTRLTPAINSYEAMGYARIPLFGDTSRRRPRACITANHSRERHYSRVVPSCLQIRLAVQTRPRPARRGDRIAQDRRARRLHLRVRVPLPPASVLGKLAGSTFFPCHIARSRLPCVSPVTTRPATWDRPPIRSWSHRRRQHCPRRAASRQRQRCWQQLRRHNR